MIASVVATLGIESSVTSSFAEQIALHPAIQAGPPVGNRVPLLIDAEQPESLEDITRWLMNLPGVEQVDVVFVHFEEELSPRNHPAVAES